MMMFHGAHTKFTAHVGLCITDDAACALNYACKGELAVGTIDLTGLRVVEVEDYNHDANEAPGDNGDARGADVLTFRDADPNNRMHTTWRLMSDAAVARFAVAFVVDAAEAAIVRDCRTADEAGEELVCERGLDEEDPADADAIAATITEAARIFAAVA